MDNVTINLEDQKMGTENQSTTDMDTELETDQSENTTEKDAMATELEADQSQTLTQTEADQSESLTEKYENLTTKTNQDSSDCFRCKSYIAKLEKIKKELIDYHRSKDCKYTSAVLK